MRRSVVLPGPASTLPVDLPARLLLLATPISANALTRPAIASFTCAGTQVRVRFGEEWRSQDPASVRRQIARTHENNERV